MTTIEDAQREAARAERRRAVRALLARPLLGQREDPETYAAIVRHRRELGDWFADHTGWQLVVDVSGGVARLHKTDDVDDATRPAVAGRQARPFDRRRYALLCLTLAVLDERPGQTTLRHVTDSVAAHSREQDGIEPFDPARMADRRALVDALKLLTGLGVIAERDGDSDRYATSEGADALYDVDDRRIAQLVAAPSSPSLVDRPEELPVEVYPDTDDGCRLRARHRVMRRILDDPVVYYADLGQRERDWLAHSLGHVHEVCDRDVGLDLERRAEGLLAVDGDGELTDETFPDGGSTVKHAALLLAEQLCARARTARADGPAATGREGDQGGDRGEGGEGGEAAEPVGGEEATRLTAELMAAYAQRCGWSGAYRERDDGAARLAGDALALLARFGLVEPADGGWRPRPAIARFAPAEPAQAGAGPARADRSQSARGRARRPTGDAAPGSDQALWDRTDEGGHR